MRYLSGCTSPRYEQALIDRGDVGLLIQPGSYAASRILPFPYWAADNACYPPDDDPKRKEPWRAATWCRMIGALHDLGPFVPPCLFILVPDWPFDHDRTLERWDRWRTVAEVLDQPLAFAIQDGATVDNVPWDEFHVAFLAGTTEWKCGYGAYEMAVEARKRGRWIHMGRVQPGRIDWASMIGCDSADGTFMKHGEPGEMLVRLSAALDRNQPRLSQSMASAAVLGQEGEGE